MEVLEEELLEANDMGSFFVIFKSSPKLIKSIKDIATSIRHYAIPHSRIEALRKEFSNDVYKEQKERNLMTTSQSHKQSTDDGLQGKMLSKLLIFSGLS
mmetsp:Transcript_7110/g.8083  ORF Transcript_7110/g.8083 Transcript_7110/m.8083 type:complete len:99 (+) Transcript_7110:1009-1305(+)